MDVMAMPNLIIIILVTISIIFIILILSVIHQSKYLFITHLPKLSNLIPVLQRGRFRPRVYVAASTDNMNLQKAQVLEASMVDQAGLDKLKETTQVMQICRSREVGQSYLTSLGTTLITLVHALLLMIKIRPQVV
ncbi:hypothetical protein MKW92_036268 [Papaver armeniacum]|nr:hypothetical protein MKW92_036268 [Papaver armeniacum]